MGRHLTIVFDWDTGECAMTDDAGQLQAEGVNLLTGLVRHVLTRHRSAMAIAKAEAEVEDARARLDYERRLAHRVPEPTPRRTPEAAQPTSGASR